MKITKLIFLFYLISIISILNSSLIISQNNFFNKITLKARIPFLGFNPDGTNYAPTDHSSRMVGSYNSMSFPKVVSHFYFHPQNILIRLATSTGSLRLKLHMRVMNKNIVYT